MARQYARVSQQEGPRLPDDTFYARPGSPYYTASSSYAPGGAWARKPKKGGRRRKAAGGGGRTVTSKSGRVYQKSAGGRYVQLSSPVGARRGRKGGRKSRKGGRRSRR